MRVPKGYKGRRALPSELYYCARCQRYHLYESHIGEEHVVFKWFDISKLDEANLHPTNFRELLKDIPEHTVHVVHND